MRINGGWMFLAVVATGNGNGDRKIIYRIIRSAGGQISIQEFRRRFKEKRGYFPLFTECEYEFRQRDVIALQYDAEKSIISLPKNDQRS